MPHRGMSISLLGRPEAEQRIKMCKDLLNSEEVQDAILPAAQLLRDVAKRLVKIGPGIRTGKGARGERRPHLRELIFATKGRKYKGFGGAIFDALNGPSVIVGVDLKQAPHAHLVEYGHVQWAGGQRRKGQGHLAGKGAVEERPFLRPAVSACRGMIVQIIESALRRMLAPYSKAA